MADRAIANRRRFWRSERQRNALTATCVFISSMEHRDMEGDLRFDHDNSQLFVRVSPLLLGSAFLEPADELR